MPVLHCNSSIMSDQTSNGAFDSTFTSAGHTRSQPEDQSSTTEQTATESRTGASAPQHSVTSKFVSGLKSEQDPRSTAAANGAQTPPVSDSPLPSSASSSAYEATQKKQPPPPPIAKPYTSKMSHTREVLALERLRRQQIKAEQAQLRNQKAENQTPQKPQKQHSHQLPQPQLRHTSGLRVSQRKSQQAQQQESRQPSPPAPSPRSCRLPRHEQPTAAKIDLPVTKATLSELDVTKIIHNPKLRHDINYDPELHFRPNLDGEKGRRKQEKAHLFWENLRDELTQFVINRDEFLSTHGPTDEWSLPALLGAVKDIIQTLVPARDREVLNEGLNIPLLMQQFARGIVDLEKLAAWLSSVLKMHCAPMRDEWVDEMYNELSRGNRENDIDELVKGLSSLLSVLEAMKLDVANHQIRCLRPLLIEDTVHFEQRFFCKKIQNKRMSVEAAGQWYEHAKAELASPDVRHRQAFGDMSAFFGGLVNLLLPSVEASQVPNTFLFDEDRILKLRADMFDAIHLEICMRVYERAASWEADGMSPDEEFDFNTPPESAPSSRPSSLAFSNCGSSGSSPRNSRQFLGKVLLPAHDPEDFAEARQRAQNLYSRLVILLQSVPATARPAQRWEDLWTNMAVEMCNALGNIDRAEQIEDLLKSCVDPASAMKQEVEAVFKKRLLSALAHRVKDLKSMPSVGLFVVAAGGRIHPHSARVPESTAAASAVAAAADAAATAAATMMAQKTRVVDPREDGCVEDMATRLTHLGILHWRVWSGLVYEPVPEVPPNAPMPLL